MLQALSAARRIQFPVLARRFASFNVQQAQRHSILKTLNSASGKRGYSHLSCKRITRPMSAHPRNVIGSSPFHPLQPIQSFPLMQRHLNIQRRTFFYFGKEQLLTSEKKRIKDLETMVARFKEVIATSSTDSEKKLAIAKFFASLNDNEFYSDSIHRLFEKNRDIWYSFNEQLKKLSNLHQVSNITFKRGSSLYINLTIEYQENEKQIPSHVEQVSRKNFIYQAANSSFQTPEELFKGYSNYLWESIDKKIFQVQSVIQELAKESTKEYKKREEEQSNIPESSVQDYNKAKLEKLDTMMQELTGIAKRRGALLKELAGLIPKNPKSRKELEKESLVHSLNMGNPVEEISRIFKPNRSEKLIGSQEKFYVGFDSHAGLIAFVLNNGSTVHFTNEIATAEHYSSKNGGIICFTIANMTKVKWNGFGVPFFDTRADVDEAGVTIIDAYHGSGEKTGINAEYKEGLE